MALRSRHCSPRTEEAYSHWVKRFIFFHHVRHPGEMAEPELNAFLTHLAIKERVAASTQTQALSALLFLYGQVLGRELGTLDGLIRARKPRHLPVVMTREEVKALLAHLGGDKWLMANLMYGAGLRLRECVGLRVHGPNFGAHQITVRDGKGRQDRLTRLPESAQGALQEHPNRVREIHRRDLAAGYGRVELPYALARKYPNAPAEWGWQWVFLQEKRWVNPQTGAQGRHHVDESILQKAFTAAVRQVGLAKRATCHTLRPSFATHLLEAGYDLPAGRQAFGPFRSCSGIGTSRRP